MAGGVRLELRGVKETIDRLKKEGIDIKNEVGAEVANTATDVVRMASQLAPKNMGNLANTISPNEINTLSWEVVAQSQYAAYMEFGTKRKVQIPAGFEAYASQFRGSRKTGISLYQAIKKWVKDKGIDEKAAWPIARSIMLNGVNPQPFMFPALMRNKQVFVQRIKKVLDRRR